MNIKEFENLYKQNYTSFLLMAFKIVRDQTMAEDVVQAFFESIWIKKDTLILHKNFSSYGMRSVKNLSLKQLEKREKEKNLLRKEMIFNLVHSLEDANLKEIKLEKVNEILQRIPESRRNIFLDYVLGGLSYKEIAEMRNISINTVRVQMQRVYNFIRKAEIGKISLFIFFIDSLKGLVKWPF